MNTAIVFISRIEGTPMTWTWPEWPPEANSMYSSRPPGATNVLMRALGVLRAEAARLRHFQELGLPAAGRRRPHAPIVAAATRASGTTTSRNFFITNPPTFTGDFVPRPLTRSLAGTPLPHSARWLVR